MLGTVNWQYNQVLLLSQPRYNHSNNKLVFFTRTGRRINMRKVISYIASEFRKDRIWLRRTRPWKREHQIVLAIDDSSSMADNKSKVSNCLKISDVFLYRVLKPTIKSEITSVSLWGILIFSTKTILIFSTKTIKFFFLFQELAFESLALVSKALTLLEAGELSVLSFGESSKVLHPLGEPFTEETGAR